MSKKPINKVAFSLLEMSIVMLIIGFLVLGIATAKNIIDLARITNARVLTQSSIVNGVKNLELWLEATSEASFIASGVINGSAINIWYDINTQSTVKKNATAGNAPTYILKAINGLPALRFDGAANYFDFDGTFLAGANYTIFVVEQRRSNSSLNYFIGGGTASTNSAMHLGYRTDTSATHAQFGNDYDYNAIPSYSSPVPRIHSYVFSSVTGKVYRINGSQVASKTDVGGLTPMAGYLNAKIGRNWAANYYNGDIGEIIMFSRTLSSFERSQVEDYLSKKWKISLS